MPDGSWFVVRGSWNVECGMWNVECGMWNEFIETSLRILTPIA